MEEEWTGDGDGAAEGLIHCKYWSWLNGLSRRMPDAVRVVNALILRVFWPTIQSRTDSDNSLALVLEPGLLYVRFSARLVVFVLVQYYQMCKNHA